MLSDVDHALSGRNMELEFSPWQVSHSLQVQLSYHDHHDINDQALPESGRDSMNAIT